MALADSVLVMFHGAVTAVVDPEQPGAKARIGAAMLGEGSGAGSGEGVVDDD